MNRTVRGLVAALAGVAGSLSAQTRNDSALITHVGARARSKAAELPATGTPPNAAALTQYREALGSIERGELAIAATELTAALQRSRNNALFLGELGLVRGRLGQFGEAVDSYTRAYRAEQRNAWYLVGVSAAQAAQRLWVEAAGTIQLAANTDSAVVDSIVARNATEWFEQAGDRTNALAWARLTAARAPGDAQSWLRIGLYLKQRNDTTPEAIESIRRYVALRGDSAELVASAVLADWLYAHGQTDSALVVVARAARDTSYREYAAQLHLQAGRDAIQLREPDRVLAILDRGRPWATPAQQVAFANITGRAQLLKLNAAMTELETNRECGAAHRADTLINETERNLTAGLAFDSSRTAMMITVLPGYRTNAQNAIRNCRPAGQTAPARRPAPATPPRRPRP